MERKWYVRYSYQCGEELDTCTVWVEATDREDAITQVMNEYWDVVEIIDAYPA